MKKKRITYLAFLLLILVSLQGYSQTTADAPLQESDSLTIGAHTEFAGAGNKTEITKAMADSAYVRNDYVAAIEIYEALLQQGEAYEVYYNLGNSYYKAGNIARAILNYERALLLQPGNPDIRANLEIARAKTVDKLMPIPELFFVTWIKSLINIFSADTWAKVGIGGFLMLLLSLSFFFFGKQILLRKLGFASALFFLLCVVFANIFAYRQKLQLEERRDAVVLTPSVTVRSTPSESGTSLFILHEGRKVQIKDDAMREWKEIRLEDGKVGWVPASSIERI